MCMMHHMMEHSEHNDQHARASEASPLDILKRRFALGEITREQYKEMVEVLSDTDTETAHHEIH